MSTERAFVMKKAIIALFVLAAVVAVVAASRFTSQAKQALQKPQEAPVWDFNTK